MQRGRQEVVVGGGGRNAYTDLPGAVPCHDECMSSLGPPTEHRNKTKDNISHH